MAREKGPGTYAEHLRERSPLRHQLNGSLRSGGKTAIRKCEDYQTEKNHAKVNFEGTQPPMNVQMIGMGKVWRVAAR